jgi:hypothetical protein
MSESTEATVLPMSVACPMCGAEKGKSCGIVWGGYMIHSARASAAWEAAQ